MRHYCSLWAVGATAENHRPTSRLALTEAARRWAALLQQIVEVDPLACPTCHRPLRIIAFITQESVIDKPVAHLRTRAVRRRDMAAADTANPLRLLAGARARVARTR